MSLPLLHEAELACGGSSSTSRTGAAVRSPRVVPATVAMPLDLASRGGLEHLGAVGGELVRPGHRRESWAMGQVEWHNRHRGRR